VLRRIPGPERWEITGGQKTLGLYKEKLHGLYTSQNIKIMETSMIRRVRHVTSTERCEMHTKF